jgi:hypothetical protein
VADLASSAVDELIGQAPKAAPAPSLADDAVDQMLGGAVKTTPGGAVTGIHGRGMPRNPVAQAEQNGLTIDDLEFANAEAGVTDKTVADFKTLTKAAMVDDAETKLRIFAKARFPKDPEAVHRYGIIDGEVIYLGDDEKLYRESPKGFLSGAKEFAAGVSGAALPIAGGAIGGSVAAPGLGTVAGAVMGAAGGEAARKLLGGLVFDEPATTEGVLKSMAAEGAWSLGGALVGKGLVKWLNRRSARDLARLDPAAADDLVRKAQAQGIDLNVAQKTNLPSVKGTYDVLATHPASKDIIQEAAEKTARQADDAVERFLRGVSPVEGLDEAGTAGRNAAKKVISALTKERADAASPLYRRAFSEFDEFTPELGARLAKLRTSPSFRHAERVAKTLYEDDLAILKPSEMPVASALRDLHYTKLALDKLIGDSATGGYQKTSRKALIGLKNELLSVMDEASPNYKQARGIFGHLSPNIESVQDGVIARIAGLGDEQALKGGQMLFNPQQSPTAVARARELFTKAGLGDDWNAMLKSYLADSFEKAGREFATKGGQLHQAPNWRAALVGNPRQYRVLEKAMDPQTFQAFNDLTDVLHAIGRTAQAGTGSQTAGRLVALKELERQSGAGAIGQVAGLASPQTIGQRILQWQAEVRLGHHAEKLAEIMTSPDGQKRLRELSKLSPGSEQFITKAGAVFGIAVSPDAKPKRRRSTDQEKD